MTGQRAIEAGTPPSPEVSAVIPVHDNAATLEQLHARLTSTLVQMGQPFELVFVDDASRDASLEVLGQIASRDARTVVLPLPRNVGQHRPLLAGMARACGHWTLIMDADLQDAPETVVSLLAQRGQGYAAVFGGRRGNCPR